MALKRAISLDHLTALELSPVELIELAVEIDCPYISILPSMPSLPELGVPDIIADRALHRKIAEASSATGVGVRTLEGFILLPDTPPEVFDPLFERAAAIECASGVAVLIDPEVSRVTERLAALCEKAAAQEMSLHIEYVPTTTASSMDTALSLIEQAGSPNNAALVVDILHHLRSGGTIDDLRRLDPARVGAAQIDDGMLGASWEHYTNTEMLFERLVPGEGDFPLEEFVSSLPPEVIIGVEVPLASRREAGDSPQERARRAVAGAVSVIEAAG